ncbi:DNA ligase 1-like [Helianthus annuus]|uniref:DNA ligase 1-like n=1 Tax=Helianthus annuus TaxID=4232 RepID=UPI000B8FCE45|nr:DNA ligase 1-like [Helianthus annuus]
MAKRKVRSREEILKEKTERERFIVGCRMEKMQEAYENAVRNKRWDKNRACYVNKEGEPVVPRRDIVHDDVLLVIPLSGEFYSKRAKDKNYEKNLNKIIRHAMTSSLRKRDEERMKKNVEELVNDLKKVAEEVKVEAVKVEDVKIEEEKKVIKEVVEEEMKKKEEGEVKDEILEVAGNVDDSADAGNEKKKREADQEQMEANTEVPITEVLPKKTECQPKENRSSLAREEEAADPCDG